MPLDSLANRAYILGMHHSLPGGGTVGSGFRILAKILPELVRQEFLIGLQIPVPLTVFMSIKEQLFLTFRLVDPTLQGMNGLILKSRI